MPFIFVSYRRSDSSDITGRICDRLVKAFGQKNVFIDVDSIPAGENFTECIEQKIKLCQVFIAVIGHDWIFSSTGDGRRRLHDPDDVVRLEISEALKNNIRCIPLLVDDTEMPAAEELPVDLKKLASLNAVHVRTGRAFHRNMDVLIEDIQRKRFTTQKTLICSACAGFSMLFGLLGWQWYASQTRLSTDNWDGEWTCSIPDEPELSLSIYGEGNSSRLSGYYRKAHAGLPADEKYTLITVENDRAKGTYIYKDANKDEENKLGIWTGTWEMYVHSGKLILTRRSNQGPWVGKYTCLRKTENS